MQVIILYPTGKRMEGLILAVTPERMRLAVRNRNETIELRQIDGQWLTDEGDPVEFDAIVADGAADRVAQLFAALAPKARAAS
jgi:hypothetical protein